MIYDVCRGAVGIWWVSLNEELANWGRIALCIVIVNRDAWYKKQIAGTSIEGWKRKWEERSKH